MGDEREDRTGQTALCLYSSTRHHHDKDDPDAEGRASRQGLNQTVHRRGGEGHWVSGQVYGGEGCFAHTPNIPYLTVQSYANWSNPRLSTALRSNSRCTW